MDTSGYTKHSNGGGLISPGVEVPESVYVGPRAVIYGGEFRGGVFRGGVFYDGEFRGGVIHGGVFYISPILIYGSRHSIGMSRPGYIQSGCIEKPIGWWKDNATRCGEANGYSQDQIDEYAEYLIVIENWMKRYGYLEEEVKQEA